MARPKRQHEGGLVLWFAHQYAILSERLRRWKKNIFTDFVKAHTAEDRHAVDGRALERIYKRANYRKKAIPFDLGLIRDDSVLDYNDLPDPADSAEEAAANLEEAVDLMRVWWKELRALGGAGLMAKAKKKEKPDSQEERFCRRHWCLTGSRPLVRCRKIGVGYI